MTLSEHEAIAAVRGWHRLSALKNGYSEEERRHGIYGRDATARNAIIVRDLEPEEVDSFLEDALVYFRASFSEIYIEDATLDERLRPAFIRRGWYPIEVRRFLAYDGAQPSIVPVPGLRVEDVTEATLPLWAETRLRAVNNDDTLPAETTVRFEQSFRRRAITFGGYFRLAWIDDTPVAVLGWYEDNDRVITHLATSAPYHKRGIARYLVSVLLAESAKIRALDHLSRRNRLHTN